MKHSERDMLEKAKSLVQATRHDACPVKQVAVFGASFNPITIGHLAFMNYLLAQKLIYFDSVYVIPAGFSPLKSPQDYAPALQRRQMLDLAVAAHVDAAHRARLRIVTLEIDRPLVPSQMIMTLAHLVLAHQGQESYTLVCGTDHLLSFDKWYLWSEFGEICTLIFYPRANICLKSSVPVLCKLLQAGLSVRIVFNDAHEKNAFAEACRQYERFSADCGNLELLCDPLACIPASAASLLRAYYAGQGDHHWVAIPPGITPEVHHYIVENSCYSTNTRYQ